MVMKRWADVCLEAYCSNGKVGFLYSEMHDSAAIIATRLNYSKIERDILCSLFAAFSTLSLILNSENCSAAEIFCKLDGAVGGFYVRITHKGEICGYLHNRVVLPSSIDVDDDKALFNYIFGIRAKFEVIRYTAEGEKKDLLGAECSAWPDEILKHIVQHFMNRKATVILNFGASNNDAPCYSLVVVNNAMLSKSNKEYSRLSSKESISKIQEVFATCASVSAFRVELDVPDLLTGPGLTIQPGCTCSEANVIEEYKKLSDAEFKQLGTREPTQNSSEEVYSYEFRCNRCGRLYNVKRCIPLTPKASEK